MSDKERENDGHEHSPRKAYATNVNGTKKFEFCVICNKILSINGVTTEENDKTTNNKI